ncbi:MAG: FAD-dependent oxidoreductase [Chloroherpetonaceae bacterium]|nr:FAD-binding oxidoreductase [Chthonomonadaceae bacterium]MDW8208003.1 FAD-dependent oxidoreductase [Chloroherpetonaceae bacterium]
MAELADVVIVGGGILGAALTYELTQRHQRVVLLEAHAFASGATGSGFGWINATSKTAEETQHRLHARAMACYDALALEWGAEQIGLREGGALFWVPEEDAVGRERLMGMASRLQGWGYPVALLNTGEILALEPRAVTFRGRGVPPLIGLFAPMDRWLDTVRFTRLLIDIARRRGAIVYEYTPAIAFVLDSTRRIAQVKTPERGISTSALVLAAGVQTPVIASQLIGPAAGQWIPLRSAPGILVETAPESASGLIHRVLYPPDSGGLHLRPTASGGVLVGAEDLDRELQQEIREETVRGAPSRLLARVADVLPGLASMAEREAQARVCLRPFPADGRPIVGDLPEVREVFVAVAHSAVTLAPLLARLLAEQIVLGRVPSLLAPYRPHRFGTSGA